MWSEALRLPEKTHRTPPTRSRPRGAKAKRIPPGFSIAVSCSSCSPSSLSHSLSFGCGDSSWNIRTIQSSSAGMKAPDPVDNWFPGGAAIPLNLLDSLPPSSKAPDEETREIPADQENMTSASSKFMKLQALDLLSSFSSVW